MADLVGTQTRDLEFVDRTRARSLLFKHNAAPARVVHVLSRRGVGLPELELAVLGLSCKRKIALHRIELGLRGTDLLLAEALFGQTPLGVKPFGLRFCATALDLERTRVEAPGHVARLHGLAFLPEKLGDAPAPLEGQGHLARIHAAPGHGLGFASRLFCHSAKPQPAPAATAAATTSTTAFFPTAISSLLEGGFILNRPVHFLKETITPFQPILNPSVTFVLY